jgi:hypothetical protein
MSDMSKRVRQAGRAPLSSIVIGCVIALCVVACALTFLLPADSLVVDLVYQGF